MWLCPLFPVRHLSIHHVCISHWCGYLGSSQDCQWHQPDGGMWETLLSYLLILYDLSRVGCFKKEILSTLTTKNVFSFFSCHDYVSQGVSSNKQKIGYYAKLWVVVYRCTTNEHRDTLRIQRQRTLSRLHSILRSFILIKLLFNHKSCVYLCLNVLTSQ